MRSNMGRVVCYFVSLSAVTQALLQNRQGWGLGGGVSYGDNLSQVTLMEGGKALHSACEWAAAGPDAHNNSI